MHRFTEEIIKAPVDEQGVTLMTEEIPDHLANRQEVIPGCVPGSATGAKYGL